MLNQPTSSPMMNKMLGFLACAYAGAAAPKSVAVKVNTQKTHATSFESLRFMAILSICLILVVGCQFPWRH